MDLQAALEEVKLCATQVWAGAVRRSREFEDQYWMSDNIYDAVQPVIINIDSDDEDGDDDFFLESDSD